LVFLNQGFVLLDGVVFVVGVLEEEELLGALVELRVAHHAVFDEHADVIPVLLVGLAVFLEELFKFLGHLLGDVGRDFLHVLVALQERTADVQRDVGRVNDAVQQREELG